jgi:hypothetical protein
MVLPQQHQCECWVKDTSVETLVEMVDFLPTKTVAVEAVEWVLLVRGGMVELV